MNMTNKAEWQTPELATLDVTRTLGGILAEFKESFTTATINDDTLRGATS